MTDQTPPVPGTPEPGPIDPAGEARAGGQPAPDPAAGAPPDTAGPAGPHPGRPARDGPLPGSFAPAPVGVPPAVPPMPAFSTPPGATPPTIRFEPVPGTPYGLAYVQVTPVTSGPAAGALAAGIASIVVALVMLCLGLAGSGPGWGALVAGAFAILAALFGVAGVAVGTAAARRIPPRPVMVPVGYGMPGPMPPRDGGIAGRGMAVAGRTCGYVGLGLAVTGFILVLLATAGG